MKALFYSLLGYFLSPLGIVLMGVLDSSIVFFFPLGIDFIVILMAARKPELFWLYAILATIGSTAGAAFTFWVGRKVGKHGLSKLIKPARLKRVQQRVSSGAAYSVPALAIIPPPFPFTAFVLVSGALRCNVPTFFGTLFAVRLLRFGVEAWAASYYGRGILAFMQSRTFTLVVGILIAITVIGTIVSAIAVYRGSKGGSGARTDPAPAKS